MYLQTCSAEPQGFITAHFMHVVWKNHMGARTAAISCAKKKYRHVNRLAQHDVSNIGQKCHLNIGDNQRNYVL